MATRGGPAAVPTLVGVGRIASVAGLVMAGVVVWLAVFGVCGASASGLPGLGSSGHAVFSTPTYVDYQGDGGEPSVAIDRYPFPLPKHGDSRRLCPGGIAPSPSACYRDTAYVSVPNDWSSLWVSDDLGASFHQPLHGPLIARPVTSGAPDLDNDVAIGQVTHDVFLSQLTGGCVTMNVSPPGGNRFIPDPLGCGLDQNEIDDRQWTAVDETSGLHNVYMSYLSLSEGDLPTRSHIYTLALARSTHDGLTGTFATDSVCNALNRGVAQVDPDPLGLTGPAPDSQPTPCPDPGDHGIRGGPVVVDSSPSSPHRHRLYIPFWRQAEEPPLVLSSGKVLSWSLYVARSDDHGTSWTRHLVARVGQHSPRNIFPSLAVDSAGNLYEIWSQTDHDPSSADQGGEQRVFISSSSDGGTTWSTPIDVSSDTGGSAVMPRIVAGSRGHVDLIYYQADTNLSSNLEFVDTHGNPCTQGSAGCGANPSQWKVIYRQSLAALAPAPSFTAVQLNDRPIHIGPLCTNGDSCSNAVANDRNLLDFFSIALDHLGAAHVAWSDDNNAQQLAAPQYTRQLSGPSLITGQTIDLLSQWPAQTGSVSDPAGDTVDPQGRPFNCPGMDLLGAREQRSGSLLTVTLKLAAPPSAAAAKVCARGTATGGLWGVEFWAPSAVPSGGTAPNDNFYLAYRDDLSDTSASDGPSGVQAGEVTHFSFANSFNSIEAGSPSNPGGTCFASPPPAPCDLSLTANLAGLGIPAGAPLRSITGLSIYRIGASQHGGIDTEQADVTASFTDPGS